MSLQRLRDATLRLFDGKNNTESNPSLTILLGLIDDQINKKNLGLLTVQEEALMVYLIAVGLKQKVEDSEAKTKMN